MLQKYLCFKKITRILFVVLILVILAESQAQINPYKILGLPKNANEKQIRNAYRKLAKDWHPDRNKSPEAAEKFMQINQAYEILSDEERRSMYDEYGTTSEPRQGHSGGFQRENYEQFFHGFESFFGGRGGGFRFFNGGNRKSSEEEINKKIYEEIILPNSHVKPFLIYSYTEFCMMCMNVESTWEQLKQEIKNIGFGAGHSDASWNRELSKMLGISSVPSIVGVINFKVYHFHGEFTIKNLREFVRKLIPTKLITEVNMQNFNQTLIETLEENKVFTVFASHSNHVTLRYQMPCFQMLANTKCASIKLNSLDTQFRDYLFDNFSISLPPQYEKQESLFLFKENMFLSLNKLEHRPVYSQRASEISFANILQTFETNMFLNFPRLSSSKHFFDLCTSWSQTQNDFESNSPSKVICVVIFAEKSGKTPSILFNSDLKAKLVKRINEDDYFKQLAQFTYLFADVQTDFVEKIIKNSKLKLTENNKSNNILENKIALLKRLNDKYAQFDLFDLELTKTIDSASINKLIESVKDLLNSVTIGSKKLGFKMPLPEFYDESPHNLLQSLLNYIEEIWSYLTDRLFWENLLGNNSYMMILLCTVLFVWLMMMFSSEKSNPNSTNLNKQKKESNNNNNRKQTASNGKKNQNGKMGSGFKFYSSPNLVNSNESSMNQSASTNDLSSDFNLDESSTLSQSKTDLYDLNEFKCDGVNLTEMTTQNYEALVRCLPNGYRTILLIVTKDKRKQLIEKFSKICSNYNNKSYHLRFAFLNADSQEGKKWLEDLVNLTCGQSQSKSKFNEEDDDDEFSAAKLLDVKKNYLVIAINQQRKFYLIFNVARKILNFRCRDEENIYESCLGFNSELEDKFENGLSNWLDKLTEGLNMNNVKYQVKKWPDF